MRRRGALVGGGLLFAAAAARSQAPHRPRIGVLIVGTSASTSDRIAALRDGLRERGYVEPDTLELMLRFADGEPGRAPALARELVAAQVEVIVTASTPGIRAATDASKTVPVVSAAANDLVASGLVASLARPGGNVTGNTMLLPELGAKQVELLGEILPGLVRLAVLRGATTGDAGSLVFEAIQATAAARGIEARSFEIRAADRFESVFADITAARSEAAILVDSPLLGVRRDLIATLAVARRLPVTSAQREYVDAGTLASYGPNQLAMYRRAAYFIDRILKGAKPADLPVEQPTVFDLVINLRTARALEITVPPLLLARADEVIE